MLSIPNDSLIKAKIIRVTQTGEKNFPVSSYLEILHSENVNDMPNFTKDKVGKKIRVNFRQEDKPKLTGIVDGIHVEFTGDEHGGQFFGKFDD